MLLMVFPHFEFVFFLFLLEYPFSNLDLYEPCMPPHNSDIPLAFHLVLIIAKTSWFSGSTSASFLTVGSQIPQRDPIFENQKFKNSRETHTERFTGNKVRLHSSPVPLGSSGSECNQLTNFQDFPIFGNIWKCHRSRRFFLTPTFTIIIPAVIT